MVCHNAAPMHQNQPIVDSIIFVCMIWGIDSRADGCITTSMCLLVNQCAASAVDGIVLVIDGGDIC